MKPIVDRHSRARGGFSYFAEISCAACSKSVLVYQKDGDGALLRLYLDRIISPRQDHAQKKGMPPLRCPSCARLLGMSMQHDDGRLAYRLIQKMIRKKRLD